MICISGEQGYGYMYKHSYYPQSVRPHTRLTHSAQTLFALMSTSETLSGKSKNFARYKGRTFNKFGENEAC